MTYTTRDIILKALRHVGHQISRSKAKVPILAYIFLNSLTSILLRFYRHQEILNNAKGKATAGDLRIPSTKTVTIGRRGFSVAGPAAWNNLSTTLKDFKLTFSAFKRLLKTELFKSM